MWSSWFPQLGQKTLAGVDVFGVSLAVGWTVFCLPVFCWVTRGCFECFLPRTVASTAAITMIMTKRRPPRNTGEDRRFELVLSGFAVAVGAVTTAPGVAVGVAATCVHHWFIEDVSNEDTWACSSVWLYPLCGPEGRVSIWFAWMVTVLLVYWSMNMTEPSITWMVVAPLATVTT